MSPSTRKPLSPLLRLLALLAMITLVAAACGGGDGDGDGVGGGEDEGEPVYGGSATMGLEAETNTWLPGQVASSSSGDMIQLALFDPLMRRGDDGDMHPYLAESVEPNDDLTVWTVTLREGVQFHDGTPLNAEAMKYNFDVLLMAEESNVRGTLVDTFKVQSLDVVDELTFTYTLEETNAAFADILDGTIGMPFSPTAHEADPEGSGDQPVGTGPFVFDSWQRDSRLVVKKNPDYWMEDSDGNQLPYLDEVVFRPIEDENTRFQSLLSGDVDAFHTLRQSNVRDAREAAERGEIEVAEFIGNNGGGSIFNTNQPPVDDVRVRQGLAYALDQEILVDILGGTGITPPQTQYFSPDSPWFSEEVEEAWPKSDSERAQELLDAYVNDPERSDGKGAGEPIEVEFNCPPDPSLIELSQAYQQMWSDVGVNVNLNQVEQSAHIQNAIQDQYMINCWRMGGQDDPFTVLSVAFGDPEVQPLNFTNYTDPIIDENLDVLRTETDFDARYEAVENIMMHFTEAVPNLWTGGTATTVGYEPSLRNVDGWNFPDGTDGEGVVSGVVTWSQVWRAE